MFIIKLKTPRRISDPPRVGTFEVESTGMTLVEVLIYIAILSVSLVLIVGIVAPLLRSNETATWESRIRENIIFIFSIIDSKVLKANSITVLPDFGLRFTYPATSTIDTIRLSSSAAISSSTNQLTGYFFNYDEGFLSLNCSNNSTCGTVNYIVSSTPGTPTSTFSGWAWSPNVGWVSFYCGNPGTSGCASSNYQVTQDSSGNLYGWAWNNIIGWVSFNCADRGICSTSNYKVYKDSSGNLYGYAWNDHTGWIYFQNSSAGSKAIFLKEGTNNEVQVSTPQVSYISFNVSQINSTSTKPTVRISITMISPPIGGQQPITVSSQSSFSLK